MNDEEVISQNNTVSQEVNKPVITEPEKPVVPDPYSMPSNANSGMMQAQQVKNHTKQLAKQLEREDASSNKKMRGVIDTWENTYLATGIDWINNDLAYIMDDEDKGFTSTLTSDFIDGWLVENGLPIKFKQRMQSAKNQGQFDAYAAESQVDFKKAQNSDAVLNSYGGILTEKTVATITTGVFGDVDTFVPIIGWAAKAAKISRITAGVVSGTLHGTAATIAYSKDPDVTAGEALVSGIIGGAFDGGATAFIARKKGPKQLGKTPDNDTLNTNVNNANKDIHEQTVELSKVDKNQVVIDDLAVQANKKNKAGEFTAEADKARKKLNKAILEQRALKKNVSVDEIKRIDKLEKTAKDVTSKGVPTKRAREAQEELTKMADENDLNRAVLDNLTDDELAVRQELRTRAAVKDKNGKTPDDAFDAQTELNKIDKADKEVVARYKEAKIAQAAEVRKQSKIKQQNKKAFDERKKKYLDNIKKKQAQQKAKVAEREAKRKADAEKQGKKLDADAENRRKQTLEKKHKKEVEEAEWETKFYKAEADDILRIADDIKNQFNEISKRIKKGVQTEDDLQLLKDIRSQLQATKDRGLISDEWFKEFTDALDSAEGFKKFKVTFKKDKNGKYFMQGSTAKVVVPASVLLVGTGLFADEDGATINTTNTFAVALGMAVLFGLSGGRVQGMFSELKSVGARIVNKNDTSTYMQKVDAYTDTARISFMERYTQIFTDGGEKMKEFADMVLWNALDGSANSMDTIKKVLVQEWNQNLLNQMDIGYKSWMKEQQITSVDRVGNMFQSSIGYRQRFEKEVFAAIESGEHASDSIMETAKQVNKIKRKAYDEMVAAGVNGIENVKFDDTYMPRSLRTGYIGTVLRGANQESIDRFVKMVAGMMTGADDATVLAKAKAYVAGMTRIGESRDAFNTIEGLRDYMKAADITGVTAEEMADFMGIGNRLQRDTMEVGEQFSRTKKRIEIDKSKWEDLTIYGTNGEGTDIILDSVFKSQVTEVMSTYFNQVAGQVAIASKGKTVPEMYAYAKTSISNGKVVEEIVDDLLGMPILDEHSTATKLMRDLSNYNVASTMGMSVLTLMQESVLIMSNMNKSGFKTALGEFKNIFLKHGTSSELVQSFKDHMGVGMHKQSASYGTFNHMAEANLMDGTFRNTASGQFVSKVGETARDITLYNLGMVPVSDYFSSIASAQNLQRLGEFFDSGAEFSSARMKAYGLSDANIAMIKDYVKLTPEGYAKAIDWDAMPSQNRIALKSVLFNMNQKQIMQTTNGSTGHWTTASNLGVAVSQLLKFPMGAYTNHGLFRANSMARGDDMRTYAETLGWFMSGYMVSVVRSELKGQDKTDEEHLIAAIMSMNVMGVVNVARGLSDPAIFSTAENMKRLQNIVN